MIFKSKTFLAFGGSFSLLHSKIFVNLFCLTNLNPACHIMLKNVTLFNLIVHSPSLKLASTIFYQIFISHQTITLQKLWKMFFISSEKLFSFARYSDFCISIFPSFPPVSHCFKGWSKINLKVYDVINCLNQNLITCFVWYLEKEKRYEIETLSIDIVLNKEHFYGKVMQKMCHKS